MEKDAATLDYAVKPAGDGSVEITFTQDDRHFSITTDRAGLEELIGALRQARDAIDVTQA